MLAEDADYWLRVTKVILFHSWYKETHAEPSRPLGQSLLKYLKYFYKAFQLSAGEPLKPVASAMCLNEEGEEVL